MGRKGEQQSSKSKLRPLYKGAFFTGVLIFKTRYEQIICKCNSDNRIITVDKKNSRKQEFKNINRCRFG